MHVDREGRHFETSVFRLFCIELIFTIFAYHTMSTYLREDCHRKENMQVTYNAAAASLCAKRKNEYK